MTTRGLGVFATAGHLRPRKTTYFQARVSVPIRNTPCTGGAPGINCVSATLDPWAATSRVVKIAIKRKLVAEAYQRRGKSIPDNWTFTPRKVLPPDQDLTLDLIDGGSPALFR